ncbi:cytochrome ubiquinol oxidase subunit I [Sneathiella sp.]|uniref:cytochrome ubiquinol oxidase subunit I n=1 Tax=Sneathiella sp. TaxID=1964365 RepID=UPI00356304A4
MFDISALDLARMQFAFTISFHIIFPAFSIGLASYLAVLEGLWLLTKDNVYMRTFNYWRTIFAIGFGMGVVSGIVMAYQFGTNWAVFSDKAGPVIGPLMGYEVMSAFFLEAGFLGVMLFGQKRVGPKLHFFATLMVAAGTLFSAFWILSVNSWMQTPTGHTINAAGQFVPDVWLNVIFNPSFPYRFVHMVLAAYLTTAFVVGAVGAYHLLKVRTNRHAQVMFSMAMWMAAIVTPIQMFAGDQHGLNTLEYQPAKIAAIEGHYENVAGAPLVLFGIPDDEKEKLLYAIEIPRLGALILTHTWDGELRGLKSFPKADRPNTFIVFWAFRVMVGMGIIMLAIGIWSIVRRLQGRLFEDPLLARAAVMAGPVGFIAVLCGWITTEAGRQPWTVYGLLRTADSASSLNAAEVGISLLAFIVIYFTLFGAGVYYMLRLMAKPPINEEAEPSERLKKAYGITATPMTGEPTSGGPDPDRR